MDDQRGKGGFPVIYLDNAASAPALDCAIKAAMPFLTECCGNPSSIHTEGRTAALALIEARERCAAALSAQPEELIFTSGGTEADNMAIRSAALSGREAGKIRIVTTAIEHPAVLESCRYLERFGFEVKYLGVNSEGFISAEQAREIITPDTAVVSVMTANNEVGTIQPVQEIADICRSKGVLFHTDAVQAVGLMPLSVRELGCDMLSVSAHKFGGIRGAGLLYCRKGCKLSPLIYGGGQENGMRSGTENTPAIAAMGAAIEYACRDIGVKSEKMTGLRDRLISMLLEIPGSRLNGGIQPRLCNNVNVSFAGVEGESLVLGLDLRGVCATSGSACASGNEAPSHVLKAMNVPEEMLKGSLRLSLSEFTTEEEIQQAAAAVRETVEMLRSFRRR